MATFTLTGDINELTGEDASRVTLVRIQSSHPLHDPTSNVVYPLETLVSVVGGEFTVTLPSDATPAGYYFTVTANQIDGVWQVPAGATGSTVDLSDADVTAYSPSRHAKAHGNVSGAVEVSANYGLHTMTLTDDAVLTPTGRFGQDIAVRANLNGNALTIDDAVWDGGAEPALPDPATISFLNFDPDGWIAFAVGAVIEPTEVTPTFTNANFNTGAGTVTLPSDTGVRYKIDGVTTAAGVYGGQEGYTVVTAEPSSSAYYFPGGATTSWNATFPGWSTWAADDFTAANGTDITGRSTPTGAKAYSSVTAGTEIQANRVKSGQGTTPNTGFDWRLTGHPANTPVRITVAFDVSDNDSGYTPYVYAAIAQTSGGRFWFGIENSNDWEYYPRWGWDHADANPNRPQVTYESGWSDTMGMPITTQPVTGILVVEFNPITDTHKAYIDGALVATCTTSAWLYTGGAQQPVTTAPRIITSSRWPAVDSWTVETYS
jgi:hypothetical protein